jgi:hypothetical protein
MSARGRTNPAAFAILVGGGIAGALDISYAVGFSATRGVAPIRILQSVASGLLGPRAFDGGWPVAMLGLALHFCIALVVAAIFYAASRAWRWLIEQAVVAGVLYGAVVYAVMNYVVLPLSANPPRRAPPAVLWTTGLFVHMFGIGLTIALATRAAWRTSVGERV